MMLASVARGISLFKRICSKIFEKVGRRLIGLYHAGFSGGLFGLKMSITMGASRSLGRRII